MILTTEDGRMFELSETEYRYFCIKYAENELCTHKEIDISQIQVFKLTDNGLVRVD